MKILPIYVLSFVLISCKFHDNQTNVYDESLYEKNKAFFQPGVEEYYFKYDRNRRMKKLFWDNGKVYGKGFYYGNKRVGKWTEYFEDGRLNKEFFFDDGNFDSTYKVFYPNGNIKSVERYNSG